MEKSWTFIWRPQIEACLCLIWVYFCPSQTENSVDSSSGFPVSSFPSNLPTKVHSFIQQHFRVLSSVPFCIVLTLFSLSVRIAPCRLTKSGLFAVYCCNGSSGMTIRLLWLCPFVSEGPLSTSITQLLVPHLPWNKPHYSCRSWVCASKRDKANVAHICYCQRFSGRAHLGPLLKTGKCWKRHLLASQDQLTFYTK